MEVSALDGQVAVVTGASSGIGRGIALELARAGMQVVVAARRKPLLDALAKEAAEAGARIHPKAADVSREDEVERLFAEVDLQFGRLDILVNNAGIADANGIEMLTLERWRHVMDANLTTAFLCSRAAFRRMKAAGGGRIVNIGSLSASIPRHESPVYTVSKYAIDGLTRSLALDGRDHLITATSIHPGATRSGLVEGVTDRLEKDCLLPEQIGELVVYAARLPREVALLDATILPVRVPYLGRG